MSIKAGDWFELYTGETGIALAGVEGRFFKALLPPMEDPPGHFPEMESQPREVDLPWSWVTSYAFTNCIDEEWVYELEAYMGCVIGDDSELD